MKKGNHPRGVYILFFTEFWERFGYYLMVGIFMLYMLAGSNEVFPGMGFSKSFAADIYGTYIALVYLTPFFGGIIADKLLGYRKSIYIGASLMALGYIGLSIPDNMTAFYVSLLLIILGNGLFKPNMQVFFGKLYDKPEYKSKKDAGYNLMYMSVNVGSFVCNFAAAYLRIRYGWGWAFAIAGVGMIVGIIWFALGNARVPELAEADQVRKPVEGESKLTKTLIILFGAAFAAALAGWLIPGNFFGSDSTDAFLFFCIPVIIYYFNLWRKSKKEEKEPVAALLAIFASVIVFWAVYHQNGSALTYWANYNTNREVGPNVEKVIGTIAGIEEVSTVPRERIRTGLHGEGEEVYVASSYYFDDYTGQLPQGNIDEKPADVSQQDWENIPQEDRANYGKLKLWPAELQASINPFYIIILTPLIISFFSFLQRRKKEPSTPAKIALGMFIAALSWLVMVVAAIYSNDGADKASVGWLFGIYGIITVGELFLSPMGTSLVSKLAPKHIASVMMGGWFLATAIGNKMAGVLSGMWDLFEKKSNYFLVNAGMTFAAFLLLFVLLRWLRRIYYKYAE